MEEIEEKNIKLPHFTGTGKRETLQEMFQKVKPNLENIEGLKASIMKGTPPENRSYAQEREERDKETIKAQREEISDLKEDNQNLINENSHQEVIIHGQAKRLNDQASQILWLVEDRDELILLNEKLRKQLDEKNRMIAESQINNPAKKLDIEKELAISGQNK